MSATGLDVFDKTLQTTNIWLGEIMEHHGPDRKVAWHILNVVLRALRDRLPRKSPPISARNYPCSFEAPITINTAPTISRIRQPAHSTSFSPRSRTD